MTVAALTVAALDHTTTGGIDYDTKMVAANAGGNSFANNGQQFVLVSNEDVEEFPVVKVVTVAFGVNGKVDGLTPTARTYSVAIGKRRLIGPFPPALFNDADGLVQLTYSDVVDTKVGVFSLTPA
jgi:hypothetical protein